MPIAKDPIIDVAIVEDNAALGNGLRKIVESAEEAHDRAFASERGKLSRARTRCEVPGVHTVVEEMAAAASTFQHPGASGYQNSGGGLSDKPTCRSTEKLQ